MKRFQSNIIIKLYQVNFLSSRKVILPILLFLVSGFHAMADTSALPKVGVRFANPQYDCLTQKYCLDVEFKANTPGLQLFGMNVRFYYDDSVLEYLSMGDFEEGYASPYPPQITTDNPACADLFGFAGPLEWVNGTVQLVSASTITISTTGWTKLFNVCFRVEGLHKSGVINFCPSIVWDLQLDAESGGYQNGDDGVVITIVDPLDRQDSAPTDEKVVQFNWEYDTTGNQFGMPKSMVCITEICGYEVPLSNWALFMAIGLMLVTTLFIWRRRMNS